MDHIGQNSPKNEDYSVQYDWTEKLRAKPVHLKGGMGGIPPPHPEGVVVEQGHWSQMQCGAQLHHTTPTKIPFRRMRNRDLGGVVRTYVQFYSQWSLHWSLQWYYQQGGRGGESPPYQQQYSIFEIVVVLGQFGGNSWRITQENKTVITEY